MQIPFRTRGGRYRRFAKAAEAGAILVIAMFALVALLGCAALTVDVGKMLMLASHCQAMADACALAGAGGPIINHTTATSTRIQQMFDANQLPNVPANWNFANVETYGGGDTVPGYGVLGQYDEAIRVPISIVSDFTFGRALGLTNKQIVRSAIALRSTTTSGAGVFFSLNPNSSSLGIDMSGSRATIRGTAHSNSRFDITGSNHHFTGPLEWVSRLRITGSGTILDEGDVQTGVMPSPVTFTPDMFRPYTYEINGNYSVPSSGVVPPGVYRVHGNVRVTGSSQQMANVTFIADGSISFSGSNHFYSPARLGVFAYSLSDDSTGAINISGSAPNCSGALYAPDGNVDFSGSDHQFVSVIGWTIDVSGSDFTADPTPNFGTTQYRVKLIM